MEWSTKNIAISLLLAIATITIPIVYEEYSHRSELEFRIESSNSLLPADPLLKDFLITYQGKPIKNLTRMDCTFFNSGSIPITSDDIIDEPIISFPKDSGIIAVIPLNKYPRNHYVELPLNLSKNEIKIKFNLLNPGDFIKFAIYLNMSSNELPFIVARIKGIKEIKVVNFIPTDVQTEKKTNSVIEKIILLIRYAGMFFVILLILFSGKQAIHFRRTKNLLKKNPNLLSEFNDVKDFKNFIDKNFAALGSDQKKKLLMKEIEDAEKDFSEDNKNRLIAAINNALNTRSGSEIVFIFFIILSIVFAYFYWPIL
jgi:hypothetical protein